MIYNSDIIFLNEIKKGDKKIIPVAHYENSKKKNLSELIKEVHEKGYDTKRDRGADRKHNNLISQNSLNLQKTKDVKVTHHI